MVVEPIYGLGRIREAEADEGFKEHEGAENAIALWDVAFDAEAATFFRADQRLAGTEVRDDVLEAHRFFVERQIVLTREAVDDN